MTWAEWWEKAGLGHAMAGCELETVVRLAWDAARADAEAELRGVLGDLMRWLASPGDAQAQQALARRVAAGIGGGAAHWSQRLALVAAGKGGAEA